MARFAHDATFYLSEFSKSLTDRAGTWYITLSQVQFMSFVTSYLCFTPSSLMLKASSLTERGHVRQRLEEGIDAYMKRFREKALNCCSPGEEKTLAQICLHGMLEEYRIFLEKLCFSFSKLMEAACHTNEGMQASSSKSRFSPNPPLRKRSIIDPWEGRRILVVQSSSWWKSAKPAPNTVALPCDPKKATTLLSKWVKEWVVNYPRYIVSHLERTRRTDVLSLPSKEGSYPLSNVFQKGHWWEAQIRGSTLPGE